MDDFGGNPWQGKPKGGYWLPKEFHTWPEIRTLGLAELGLFFEVGLWVVESRRNAEFGNWVIFHERKSCKVSDLVDRGLWYRPTPKTYSTKSMAELRVGRGSRGPILRLSSRLQMGRASSRASLPALGLYALAASWSLTTDRPGYIPTEAALQFGKRKHIAALWDSGLWLVREFGFCMSKGDHPVEALWQFARDDVRAPIPADIRERVMERCSSRCVRCGATDDLALDHIYPWSLGGPDDEDNLQVLCTPCNSAKGAKVLEKGAAW